MKEKSLVGPVWVLLEQLPLFLFATAPVFSIGQILGVLLKLDAATISLSHPSVACLYVKVDLRKPLPSRIWIGLSKGGFWQPIKYDHLPDYYFDCYSLAHQQIYYGKQIALNPNDKKVWRVKFSSQIIPLHDSTHLAASSATTSGLPSLEKLSIPVHHTNIPPLITHNVSTSPNTREEPAAQPPSMLPLPPAIAVAPSPPWVDSENLPKELLSAINAPPTSEINSISYPPTTVIDASTSASADTTGSLPSSLDACRLLIVDSTDFDPIVLRSSPSLDGLIDV